MNIAALKVKIELDARSRQASYPDFNTLNSVQVSNMDWSVFVDKEGLGWLYDSNGHQDDSVASPRGQQWGVLLVSPQFADEAVTAFPTSCSRLTELELQTFYDSNYAVNAQDEEIDLDILQKIALKQQLGIALTTQQQDAINPATSERGIRSNYKKTWTTFKAQKRVVFMEPL